MRGVIIAAAVTLSLGGCAINPLDSSGGPDAKVCLEAAAKAAKKSHELRIAAFKTSVDSDASKAKYASDLVSAYAKSIEKRQYLEQVDQFLDCYVGPDGGTLVVGGASPTGAELQRAEELRQFRAHAIVTLLARYAALNVSGQFGGETIPFRNYPGMDQDAAEIISSIRRVETSIRVASKLTNFDSLRSKLNITDPTATHPASLKQASQIEFKKDEKEDRIIAVMRLLVDVEKPTYERTKNAFLDFLGLVQAPTLTKGKIVLKDAANGVKKLSVVDRFRDAYRSGLRNELNALKGQDVPYTKWQEWDAFLTDACVRIQAVASEPDTCVP